MDDKNAVWIDREEYERLRRLEAQTQAPASTAKGSVDPAATPMPVQGKKNDTLIILTAISAVASFVFPPFILIFLGLGIATIIRYFIRRKQTAAGIALGAVAVVGVIAFLVVAGPFILFFGFVIIWQLGCWTGLGSCTTA